MNIDSNQFAPGDIFVQPVWLGRTMEHFAFGLSYGFYALAGRYDTETITLPVVGPIRVESTDK